VVILRACPAVSSVADPDEPISAAGAGQHTASQSIPSATHPLSGSATDVIMLQLQQRQCYQTITHKALSTSTPLLSS